MAIDFGEDGHGVTSLMESGSRPNSCVLSTFIRLRWTFYRFFALPRLALSCVFAFIALISLFLALSSLLLMIANFTNDFTHYFIILTINVTHISTSVI